MKVKCPQCGKVFDIPKAQSQRLLKCLCQALFRPSQSEIVEKKSAVPTEDVLALDISQESDAEGRPSFVDDELVDYQSSISESDMDSYLSDLRQSRDQLAKTEIESKPAPKAAGSISIRLELEERQKKKQNLPDPEEESSQSDETLESERPSLGKTDDVFSHSQLTGAPKASASPRTSNVIEKPRPSVRPQYQMIALGGTLVIFVATGFFIAQSFQEKPPPPDPYLTKLLTPPEKQVVRQPENKQPERAFEKPQAASAPVSAPKAAPTPKPVAKSKKSKPAKAKSYDPADSHLAAGIMLLNSSPRKATKEFEIALNLSPNNSQVWMNYGYALFKQKKFQAALGALRRSLDLHENDQVHYFMALTLLELNRKTEAGQHAKRAAKLNPSNSQAKSLASKLQ
jgi:tetratricopeptide (TPR) repeat protein